MTELAKSGDYPKWIDQLPPPKKVTRQDIKGIKETLEAVNPLIIFLKNFQKFKRKNVPQPPHMMFYGGPGTGKNLVSMYIAHETQTKYIHSANTKYKTWTPETIHDIFEDCRAWVKNNNNKLILFLDEIDSVAKRKDKGGISDSLVVGQLLTELDGPTLNPYGLVIIGATNNFNDIEPSIRRAKRLGACVNFHSPDYTGVLEIMSELAKDIGLPPDLDYPVVAEACNGQTAAFIKQLLEKAKTYEAMQMSTGQLTNTGLFKALVEETVGFKLPQGLGPDKALAVAIHEIGHALVAIKVGLPPQFLTLTPRGINQEIRAGCSFLNHPLESLEHFKNRIAICYGGLLAEDSCGITRELLSESDLHTASQLAAYAVDNLMRKSLTGLCNLSGATETRMVSWGQSTLPPETVRMECVKLSKELLDGAEVIAQKIINSIDSNKIKSLAEALIKNCPDIVPRSNLLRYCQKLKIL